MSVTQDHSLAVQSHCSHYCLNYNHTIPQISPICKTSIYHARLLWVIKLTLNHVEGDFLSRMHVMVYSRFYYQCRFRKTNVQIYAGLEDLGTDLPEIWLVRMTSYIRLPFSVFRGQPFDSMRGKWQKVSLKKSLFSIFNKRLHFLICLGTKSLYILYNWLI